MKRLLLIISLSLVVLVAACSRAAAPGKLTEPTRPTTPTTPSSPAPPPEIRITQEFSRAGIAPSVVVPAPAPLPPTAIRTADEQLASDRMIVRTGNVGLVVEDVPSAIEQISGMASRFKGYVVSSNVFGQKDRLFGSISIRIPAERFDEVIKSLRALAVEVTSETTNSRDVTEEFVDLSAQLKNLEATEQQLLKILDKATTVEDTLNVQRELSRVRSDIERTKGRIQFLERTSATSLIEISLQQSKLNLEFNANKTTVKEREATWFSSDIAGGFAPYSYQWELGDGTTSTEFAFSHSYKSDGRYTVILTVTDDHGNTVTKSRTDYITVIPGWSAGNIVSSAWNGLVAFGHGLANVFIWLGIFSPVWIALGLIAWGVMWYRRRQKKV